MFLELIFRDNFENIDQINEKVSVIKVEDEIEDDLR